jgi:pilus assembly protein Flp/PilA
MTFSKQTIDKKGSHTMKKLMNFLKDEEGATAVEYALMVALIAAVIIGAVQLIGTNANEKFQEVAEKIGGAGS